jgi:hypothetical protein
VTWIVLAAAERPSTLSPPAHRTGARWLLGPLQGLLPHLTESQRRLHSEMLVAVAIVGVAWVVAWLTAPALPVRVLFGASAVAHGVLFLSPPLTLTDVFDYGLYGRMAALHGPGDRWRAAAAAAIATGLVMLIAYGARCRTSARRASSSRR